MIWAAIDPGRITGFAIFDNDLFIAKLTVKDNGLLAYMNELESIKNKYGIELALIERYCNFGKFRPNASKVQEQIRACIEVFPIYVLILTQQWNSAKLTDAEKIKLIFDQFKIKVNNHEADAILMGFRSYQKAGFLSGGDPEKFLKALAATRKKLWPSQKELLSR